MGHDFLQVHHPELLVEGGQVHSLVQFVTQFGQERQGLVTDIERALERRGSSKGQIAKAVPPARLLGPAPLDQDRHQAVHSRLRQARRSTKAESESGSAASTSVSRTNRPWRKRYEDLHGYFTAPAVIPSTKSRFNST